MQYRYYALAILLAIPVTIVTGTASAASPCEAAGTEAERAFDLPSGLLLAIGKVESGRWDRARGLSVAWPWTIDVAGEGRHFETAAEAVQTTRAHQARGARNIDVGCFQISLLHHPNAFKDLEEAFDPTANALYAGKFLASLKAQWGTWEGAVAAYHSADPARGIPYRQSVFANWRGTPGALTPDVTSVVVAFGIHIWTPSSRGSAPGLISMVAVTTATATASVEPPPAWRLPRVFSQRQ